MPCGFHEATVVAALGTLLEPKDLQRGFKLRLPRFHPEQFPGLFVVLIARATGGASRPLGSHAGTRKSTVVAEEGLHSLMVVLRAPRR